MKILAIRGKNLASLADEFCVDFASAPLAGAGLYAITGATGSGKSTLLDALCLALYEKTPRLARASAPGETVPDVGQHSVGPADPRTLLRRGASDAFAEVDFVGSDGLAYRATWRLRRARNKADGRLQQSEVSLLRLDDRQLLGDHRKSETLKLIERCVGLSFEQFTRAVLLAQNDFSAFLKASDDERAELLQTLTGTETFTRISMRAFARARDEGDAVKLVKLQIEGQLPLAAPLRAAKDGEHAVQSAVVKSLERDNAAIEAQLRWQLQSAKLSLNVAQADARLAAAQAARDQAADRQAQFARVEAVQPARSRCAEVARLAREIELGAGALKETQERLAHAVKSASDGQLRLTLANRQLHDAEQARAAAQPALDQAKALDAQIDALAPNCRLAVDSRDAAKATLAQEEARHAAVSDELGGAQRALLAAQRWLVEQAPRRPLADGWQRWETLLARAADQFVESRRVAAHGDQLALREAATGRALASGAADQRTRVAEYQAAAEKLAGLSQAVAAFRAEDAAQRRLRCATRSERLADASQLWKDLGLQQQRLHQLEGQQQAKRATVDDCARQLAASAAALPDAQRDLAHAEKSLKIAELAASEGAGQLRATLKAGDPCPVCGAPDHPYAEHNPPLAAVLQRLGDEFEGARTRLSALLQQASAAGAQKLAIEQQVGQLGTDIAAAATALQHAQRLFAAQPLAAEWADEWTAVADGDRAAWFAGQLAGVKAELAELLRQESAHRELSVQRDAAQAAAGHAQAALSAATNALAALELDHQQASLASQNARQQAIEIEQQLAATQTELDAAFADGRWRAAWAADPSAFVARCADSVQEWSARQREVDGLRVKIDALGGSLQAALDAVVKASGQLNSQSERCALLAGDLQQRQAARRPLFDGQAVGAVEAAFGASIERARGELARRQSDGQQSEAERARLDEAVRQILLQNERNGQHLAAEQQALDDWLRVFSAQHGALARDALSALLALAPSWIQGERLALQALDGAIANAHAVLREHRKAAAEHLAERPAADAVDDAADDADAAEQRLRAALADNVAQLEPARARLGVVQLELAQDDERRAKSQALIVDLEKRSAAARVWSQLSELIGSADGKKFRNFAQQLTLDVLLGYANRHLETLSRRYRLERIKDSLGLLVVDRDMGDELRSVHSLSGGESFLASLALALGLASLSSHRVRVESLFIDEGFGSLDGEALGVAMAALDSLQAQGRKVGVISHVQEMTERIGTRIEVRRLAGGQSRVQVVG